MKHGTRIMAMLLVLALVCTFALPTRAETVVASGDGSASADSGIAWALYQTDSGYLLKLYAGSATAIPETAYKSMTWSGYSGQITALWIAKEITAIGKQAFAYMPALVSVEFEADSALSTVGDGAFRDSTALKEVHFGDNLSSVGKNAFLNCTALEILDFGRGVSAGIAFGATCTKYCASLHTLVMPKKIKSIGTNGFYQLHNLKNIYWYGTSLDSWDSMTLSKSYSSYLADGAVNLYLWDSRANAFSDTVLHPGTRQIGEDVTAYRNSTDTNNTLVLSGNGPTESYAAGAEAYWSDTNSGAYPVKILIITDTVTAIGDNAFADCASLSKVYYLGTKAQWATMKAASGEGNSALWNAKIVYAQSGSYSSSISYCLEHAEDGLRLVVSGSGDMECSSEANTPWYYFRHLITELVIGEGIAAIGYRVFGRMRNLSKITIPGSVTTIETEAFRYLPALKELTIPEGVTNIGSFAFACCYNLEAVNLPSTLTAVDIKAFLHCIRLTQVYYGGTQAQWNATAIDNTGGYNDPLFNAAFSCAPTPQIDLYPDAAASEYLEELQYLYGLGLISPAYGDSFGTALLLTDEEVYTALYLHAGADGAYADALDWATENGLMTGGFGLMTGTKLGALLEKTAAYNGSALSFDLPAGEAVLTREVGLAWLSRFLQSREGTADRYDQMVSALKNAYNGGTGDGNFYIITPDLYVANLGKKVGDCTLLLFPDGQTMLIDAGVGDSENAYDDGTVPTTNTQLIQLLKDIGIKNLDYFVLTHRHADHYGGCKGLFEYLSQAGGTVENYWYGADSADSAAGAALGGTTLSAYLKKTFGTKATCVKISKDGLSNVSQYTVGGVTIEIFGPTTAIISTDNSTDSTESANNTSICMKMTYGQRVFLACGDIFVSRENTLCSTYGNWLEADVVKANHHGNFQSSGEKWVSTVRASLYLAEVDGSGSSLVAQRVTEAGGQYYTTGYDGLMVVTITGDGAMELQKQYDSTLRRQDVGNLDLLTFEGVLADENGDLYATVMDLATGEILSRTYIAPAEEPADEPVDEPADEPTDEPTDEPAEEPADEPVSEPAASGGLPVGWGIAIILCAALIAGAIIVIKKQKRP